MALSFLQKRNIGVWLLYDFANSIVIVNFFLYLSQWLVVEGGLSSFWFNAIFLGSTVLLFLSAPTCAAISDRISNRKTFLVVTTIGSIIFFAATALVAQWGIEYVSYVAVLYLFAQYFYQFSFVFYNPMLEVLGTPENCGKISGLGQSANWIGQIAGIALALPFISAGRIAPLLPAVLVFFVLSLPMLFFFREGRPEPRPRLRPADVLNETKEFGSRLSTFFRHSPAVLFLVAFFFFNDAILTLTNNFPLYIEKVFAMTDTAKSFLMAGILVMSAIGAYGSGWLGDKVGMKKVMQWMLVGWIIVLPTLSLTSSFPLFIAATVLVGILYGSVWSVTRAYLSDILPTAEMNYGFSLYTLMERFATFAGPLTWGLVVYSFGESSALGYRLAALSMTVFVLIGFLLINKIPESSRR